MLAGFIRLSVLALLVCLGSAPALSQGAILQGGPTTDGHVPQYVGSGSGQPIVNDGGSAGGGSFGSNLSEIGIVARGTGTPPYSGQGSGPFGSINCLYDAPITNPTGYHFFCLSPNATSGTGLISYGAAGTATPGILQFNINGLTYNFPPGGSTPTSTFILVTDPPYNATCNGGTDDTAAIQSALNAAGASAQGGTVMIPSAICFSASGVTVPSKVRLVGNGFFPGNNGSVPGQFGSQIRCALATPVCVQVGTTNSNGTVQVSNLGVTRAAGTPSSAAIGVLIKDSYNVSLTNVGSFNHGICFEAQSDTVFGISIHADHLSTGACLDAHFVDSSWPEIFIENSRFGMDGAGDYNANAYVRFTGGVIGPNTFYSTGNQFNQGSGSVATAIEFKTLSSPTNLITSEFVFTANHFEDMVNVVKTDSSATQISRLKLIGSTFLDTFNNSEFWSFGAATQVYDLTIADSTIYQHSFTFNPGGQISSAVISNNQLLNLATGATFNGTGAGNAMSATGNVFNGPVTLSGTWGNATFAGQLLSGSLTNTTTGAVSVNFPSAAGMASCASTIGIAFGGASTGITYGTRLCTYQIVGDIVTVEYGIILTSKGSATGAATLTGLPLTTSPTAGIGGGNIVPYATNFTSLVGFGLSMSPAANTTIANIYTGASTGVVVAQDTNFTNTSTIAGTFQYRANP